MAHRFTIILALFFGLVSWLLFLTVKGQSFGLDEPDEVIGSPGKPKPQVTYGENVNYYRVNFNDGASVKVNSKFLQGLGKKRIELNFPEGLYKKSDSKEIVYKGERGWLEIDNKIIALEGAVEIKVMNSVLQSDKAQYFTSLQKVSLQGNVNGMTKDRKTGDLISVKSQSATGLIKRNLLDFSGNVNGKIQRKRVYEGFVNFSTDKISLDIDQSQIDLVGNVVFRKQDVTASSIRGQIFLSNYNKSLKYYTLYDDVKIEQKIKKGSSRKAFAEKLDGLVKEKKIILTGAPKVIQDGNVIQGNVITLFENTKVIEVDDSTSNLRVK